jgi:hypothetical protein
MYGMSDSILQYVFKIYAVVILPCQVQLRPDILPERRLRNTGVQDRGRAGRFEVLFSCNVRIPFLNLPVVIQTHSLRPCCLHSNFLDQLSLPPFLYLGIRMTESCGSRLARKRKLSSSRLRRLQKRVRRLYVSLPFQAVATACIVVVQPLCSSVPRK